MMIYNRPGQRRTPGLHSVKQNHIYGRSTMPNLTNNTINAISSAATISFLFFRNAFDGKNEAFNAHYDKNLELQGITPGNYEGSIAKDVLDQAAKKVAADILEDYNRRKAELSDDPETLSHHKLEYAMLDMQSLVLEEAVKGNNFFGVKGKAHPAFQMSSSLLPQLAAPQNKKEWEALEENLKYYPIDEYIRLGTQAQRTQLEYLKRKDAGTLNKAEDRKYREDLYQLNAEINALSRKLLALADDDRALPLFSKESYLRSDTGFVSSRGLMDTIRQTNALMETARKEGLALKDPGRIEAMRQEADAAYPAASRIPEAASERLSNELKTAMDKLGSRRLVGLFGKKNSAQYDALKNSATALQEAFEELKKGTEKKKPLNLQERTTLMAKIRGLADKAEIAANAYLEKTFKKGTNVPKSWAGLDRANGALRIKQIAHELKELALKSEAAQKKNAAQNADAARENNAVNNEAGPQINITNVDKIAEKNGINIDTAIPGGKKRTVKADPTNNKTFNMD